MGDSHSRWRTKTKSWQFVHASRSSALCRLRTYRPAVLGRCALDILASEYILQAFIDTELVPGGTPEVNKIGRFVHGTHLASATSGLHHSDGLDDQSMNQTTQLLLSPCQACAGKPLQIRNLFPGVSRWMPRGKVPADKPLGVCMAT